MGLGDTAVWIDSLCLFTGNANVFAREIDHAFVVVNTTPASKP